MFAAIVAVSVCAAICDGIVHELVTAHVCVAYFTIGHPQLIPSEDLVLLALIWGVHATWWVGLILGLALASAARLGRRVPMGFSAVFRGIVVLLIATGLFATLAGTMGYLLARAGAVVLVGPLLDRVPAEMHAAFIGDLWAHGASYLGGAIGGIVLCVVVWRQRNAKPCEI